MSWLNAKDMGFNNIAIVYIKRSAYRIYFWYISKDDAIHIINGSNLVDKICVLKISFFFFFFFVIYKNEWMQFHWVQLRWKYWFNLLSKKKDVVLSKAKDYYKNNKDRVRKKPGINTETYLKKKKNKKREYGKNRYHKMSEEKTKRISKKLLRG